MNAWRRTLRRVALGLGGVLVLAAGLAAAYVWRASPVHEGELVLSGTTAPIVIERDAEGIPTIRAASLRDALFGLGVVHAQDRLWQLETHRRIGAGRLAEAFGERALDTDRFLRALGVRQAAQAQWDRTQGASREALQAYAAGINAVLATPRTARPPEFWLLGIEPEAWTPVDSLAWAIMMAWDLGGNWQAELTRLRLALAFPLEKIEQLMPPYPGDTAPPTRDYPALYRELGLGAQVQKGAWLDLPEVAPPSGVEGTGSNNWVLAAHRTTTGAPLLANDPHLKLSAPALWYLARLDVPGLRVAGATMPGVPAVVLGQSDRIAWGFTNTGPDVQDLYLERIDPRDPSRYQTPDGWAAFETRAETIAVKGREPVVFQARRTRHGPVISDAGAGADALVPPGASTSPPYALALRWTALDADADIVAAGLRMMQADSVEGFVDASASWVAPMQNMVVADRSGRIGFVAAGRVPRRRPDNDLHGLVPAPGWEARYDWVGWLPVGDTPREFDPAQGWIATANQRIHASDYPHHLTHDWTAPWRQRRIEQMLQQRERHGVEDLLRQQADPVSLAAQALQPWMDEAARSSTHALAAAARDRLQGWGGAMDIDLAAPLIHWAWVRALTRAVFEDDFGGAAAFDAAFPARSFRDALEGVAARRDAAWCDDRRTPVVEDCLAIATRAFDAALGELSGRFGDDPARWRWGQAHQAVSEHRPFSRVKALAPGFALRAAVGGDSYTVNATRVVLKADPVTGDLFHSDHGPSLRAVYDLGDPGRSRIIHSSGQSGLPWSRQYRRFVEPWSRSTTVPLWPEPAQARAGGVLTIRPAGG